MKEDIVDEMFPKEEIIDGYDKWVDDLQKEVFKLTKECNRRESNWKELKKWLEERINNANKCLNNPNENWDEDAMGYVLARKFMMEETLNKIQKIGE